jgi:2-methylcitrate dehydratase PrpD
MKIIDWIHDVSWTDLPDGVQNQARRCLLDTVGAAIGGRQTRLSHIIRDFAASVYAGPAASLWLDGRQVSSPGAALANGMTIDSLDIHDGYTLVKGHAGAAVVPASLAFGRNAGISGPELLTAVVVGYEVALRAGRALHATACDYHTSGAWNALGCAALAGRRLGLTRDQTRHALGIAEYHGPRSQMMRCIDHPTMVKDGSGWGAMSGVSAALLAGQGFTGAPAVTVEGEAVAHFWEDLGDNWLITRQYIKPYAICMWAQPAVVGAVALRDRHQLVLDQIQTVRVRTFHEAVRLAQEPPQNTEQAQYNVPFPVAAALVYGQLGPEELTGAALQDSKVLALMDKIELVEDAGYNDRFPAERYARVEITTAAGRTLDSGDVTVHWMADDPPADTDLRQKFRWLAGSCLPPERVTALEAMIWHCERLADAYELVQALRAPPD